MNAWPWMTILLVAPALAGLVVLALPAGNPRLVKTISLALSLVVLALAVAASLSFHRGGDRWQFVQTYWWIKPFGVHYAVGTDGIALVLVALTAVLVPVVILASWRDAEDKSRSVRTFFALVLFLEALLVGVFAARDVFLFYVFFEAMLVPMYFLIGSYGGPRRSYAAVKFLLYSLAGGLLMLAALIGLYVAALHQGVNSFLWDDLVHVQLSRATENWLFLGFFAAFAVKAPLWPLHTWLPDAASQAPIGVAVLLVGVLDKVGTFGFLRYNLPLFPHASTTFAPTVIVLAVIGILYGALLAIGQKDLSRLIAYTSVSHFGFIALGIFAFTTQAQSGATLYMVNHGFSTGALFLILGFLVARRGSRGIDDFGGVVQVSPLLAGTFLVAGLSSLALPGLSSFVSEFLVLVGTFTTNRVAAIVASAGIVLAALYILIMYQRTMTGPTTPATEGFTEMTAREAWVVAPLIAIILALGLYPKPALDVINPAVAATMRDAGHADPAPTVPAAPAAPAAAGQK